jgi:CBS-domain-containing membrane protein
MQAIVLSGGTASAVALAVGTTIALMLLTRTAHAPAGSNPVIIFLAQPGWDFILFPTLSGALISN